MPFGTLPIAGIIAAIIALVFGIVVMVKPRVLAYLIGAYLIFIAVMFFIQNYALS